MLTAIVDFDADIDAQNEQGATALILAIKVQQFEFADFMVESDADCTLKTKDGFDAMETAEKMSFLATSQQMEMRLRREEREEQEGK